MHCGFTNSKRKVARVTKFCMVVRSIVGCSAWNLLHVTLLAPIILSYLLDFWKICQPLIYTKIAHVAYYREVSRQKCYMHFLFPLCVMNDPLMSYLVQLSYISCKY